MHTVTNPRLQLGEWVPDVRMAVAAQHNGALAVEIQWVHHGRLRRRAQYTGLHRQILRAAVSVEFCRPNTSGSIWELPELLNGVGSATF